MLSTRLHLYVWGALVAVILALIALNHTYAGRNIWESLTESSDLGRVTYAERIYRQNFFRTRANTWSNLAYVALGFYAFAWAAHDRHRSNCCRRLGSILVGTRNLQAASPSWELLLPTESSEEPPRFADK
jgi:hypothetical protein